MSADGSMFVSPTGKTPEQIYQWALVLMGTLNRLRTTDATDLSAIYEALADASTQIDELWEAVEAGGTGLTPQQLFELSLVTAVDTLLGSVSNLVKQSYLQSQTAADATIRSLLEGQKNKVSIRVEQAARITDREAFASQLEVIEAQIGNALASVTAETTARTNADNALAQVDQTISTALNGNIAQVQILTASIDGIEQKFAVTLNNNGQVTGLIQLDGTAAGSNFTVVADNFLVAQPDAAGGDPVPVFTIQTVGSTPKLALRGDMIANGTITAQKLVAATLSAISANLGTITAGRMQSADGKMIIDLGNTTKEIRITT